MATHRSYSSAFGQLLPTLARLGTAVAGPLGTMASVGIPTLGRF